MRKPPSRRFAVLFLLASSVAIASEIVPLGPTRAIALAQPDTAQPDTAQPDTAQPDTAQPDTVPSPASSEAVHTDPQTGERYRLERIEDGPRRGKAFAPGWLILTLGALVALLASLAVAKRLFGKRA